MSTSESPAKKGISFQRKDQHLSLTYISGLDGIRAISVIAVIFYHANFPWALGGYLGVETFFVISGYLITSLLINEWNNSGSHKPAQVLAKTGQTVASCPVVIIIHFSYHNSGIWPVMGSPIF